MPDNTSITEFLFRVQGTADINAATAAMKNADTVAKTHNATVVGGSEAQKNALGQTRREWMRTGSEASYYLTLVAGKTGQVGGQISQLTGLVTQLGESFMFGGIIGIAIAGVGLFISAIANEMKRAQEEIKAVLKPIDDLKAALDNLEKPSGAVARALYDVAGISKEVAELMASAADKGEAWRDRLREIEQAARKAAQAEMDYATARRNLEVGMAAAAASMFLTQAEIDNLNLLSISLADAKWKAYELAWQKKLLVDATVLEVAQTTRAATVQEHYNHMVKQGLALSSGQIAQILAVRNAMDALTKSIQGYIRSAVMSATVSTSVTGADIEATQAGRYIDKWDEARRRLEAIAQGTPITAYGEQFAAAFNKLGMSAQYAAGAFKDFSLFSDPRGMAFFSETGGMDALIQDAIDKLEQFVGKEQLMKTVSAQVWDKLSENMKKALRDMGIESLSDVDKAALESIGVRKAADFDATLASIRESILSNIPPELYTTIYVTYKTSTSGGAPLSPGGGIIGNAPRPGGAGPPEDRRPPIIINATIANNMDLERLAYRLGRVYQRR